MQVRAMIENYLNQKQAPLNEVSVLRAGKIKIMGFHDTKFWVMRFRRTSGSTVRLFALQSIQHH